MKTWFSNFTLSKSQQAALKSQRPPLADLPDGFHEDIMGAVRACQCGTATRTSVAERLLAGLRLAFRPGLAAALLLAVITTVLFVRYPSVSPNAQEARGSVTQSVDSSATATLLDESPLQSIASTAPLAGELAALDRDLRASASFILASVP